LWSCKTRAILVFIARNIDVGWSLAEVKSEQAAMQAPISISTMAPTLPHEKAPGAFPGVLLFILRLH
jgi:hypothetical protein